MDLMKLNVPDLLQIHSTTVNDLDIEQSFIDMLCLFIQRNAFNKLILYQTEDLMVINFTITVWAKFSLVYVSWLFN